jgi:hypothetical protein
MTSLTKIQVTTGVDVSKLVENILATETEFEKYVGGLAGADKLLAALRVPNKANWLVAAAAHMALRGPFGLDNASFTCAGQSTAYSVRNATGPQMTHATWQAFVKIVGERIKALKLNWKDLRGDSVKQAAIANSRDDLWPECGEITKKIRDPSAAKAPVSAFVADFK